MEVSPPERPRDLTASAIMAAATAEVARATLEGCRRLRRLLRIVDQALAHRPPGIQVADRRRGKPLTSQAIGMLLRNQLYAVIVDAPEYGVRAKRGDFEPLSVACINRSGALRRRGLTRTSGTSRTGRRELRRRTRWHRRVPRGGTWPCADSVRHYAIRRAGPRPL